MADPAGFWDDFALEFERIGPSSLVAHLDPTRPYDGQPHTDYGERGRTEVKGITFRDLRDCFIRACYESSGLPIEQWPGDVYGLPWGDMDIIAVAQNLSCNVEKAMGIYPNVPRLYPADPTDLHWCGPTLDVAVWQAHEGHCDDTDKRVLPAAEPRG
ncbi:MAG: hypothetical protein H6515_14350 [Microthrixaceae bacterium]|nr:hypothetical protein [Microthrixaceae bacterium]